MSRNTKLCAIYFGTMASAIVAVVLIVVSHQRFDACQDAKYDGILNHRPTSEINEAFSRCQKSAHVMFTFGIIFCFVTFCVMSLRTRVPDQDDGPSYSV